MAGPTDIYDAGPGASSSTFNYQKLTRFINRILLEKLTLKTSLRATAFMDKLRQNARVRNGQRFELANRRELSGTTKTFSPYDDANDFVGDSPYAGGPGTYNATQTYTQKDAVRQMEVRWAFIHDDIRFSNIYLTWQESEGKFMDYFVENMDYISDSLKVFMAEQLLFGAGRGGGESDFYGLYNQIVSWSGDRTAGGGRGINDDPSNTHFGLKRHRFPNMVGNIWRADIVHDPASAGAEIRYLDTSNVVQTAPSSALDFVGATYLNCQTEIDTGGLLPAAYDVHELYVYVTVNDGASSLDGQTFKRIIGVGTAGNQYLQVAQVINDPTLAAGTGINVDIQIRPKYEFADEGEAGVWTVNKVHKAYTHDGVMDGQDFIDFISVNSSRFYSFMTALQQLQRWYGEDPYLLSEGYHNFMFNAARVVVDNYEDESTTRMSNSKHCSLYFLNGYDKFQLTRQGMRPDTSGRRIDSIVGDVVVGGQVVARSPNRDARMVGVGVRFAG
jgi:hypothetical protein